MASSLGSDRIDWQGTTFYRSCDPGMAGAMNDVIAVRRLYEGWLNLLMVRLRLQGGEEADRHVIELGRAACVLPYDPDRRTALVVSMPRAPVKLLGLPDMLEAIAGALDSDEPEDCARREAMEEAGVRLRRLRHIGRIWPMPSNATEQIDYFLAPYATADRIALGGGLAEEQESITVHEVSLADLWTRFEQGELPDGKLVTLLLALRIHEPALFA
jgi:nudix-type nucleoside diphosphatase (YffH/AdpP family)